MELEKCGDADQSIEMQTALKRFDDLYNSLEGEQTKLLELENRRQKLKDDLERLRNEIKKEKNHFRSVIDETRAGGLEGDNQGYEKEQECELAEPIPLDTGAIKEFIENQREELASFASEPDLKLLKDKLKKPDNDYTEPEESLIPEIGIDEIDGSLADAFSDVQIAPTREKE